MDLKMNFQFDEKHFVKQGYKVLVVSLVFLINDLICLFIVIKRYRSF